MRAFLVVAVLLGSAGCPGPDIEPPPVDAGPESDAGSDAGRDGGTCCVERDAGMGVDSGAPDSGLPDSGSRPRVDAGGPEPVAVTLRYDYAQETGFCPGQDDVIPCSRTFMMSGDRYAALAEEYPSCDHSTFGVINCSGNCRYEQWPMSCGSGYYRRAVCATPKYADGVVCFWGPPL